VKAGRSEGLKQTAFLEFPTVFIYKQEEKQIRTQAVNALKVVGKDWRDNQYGRL
jgi:hypothetical protein